MTAQLATTGVPTNVARAVHSIYSAHGGDNLAEHVLAAAEAGDPDLRGYFEWDDSAAARAYRLDQAQALVRRVRVTLIREGTPEPITVRAYVSGRDLPSRGDLGPGSYVAIEDVAGATDRASLMAAIERDVQRLRRKYAHVADFLQMAITASTTETTGAPPA